MNYYVTDTHTLFWYLTDSPRLGANALNGFEEGARGEALIYIPAIVLAELYFLNNKVGQPIDFEVSVDQMRNSGQFVFVPFNGEDALSFTQDAAVPEMHDRIIVGVARRFSAICLTLDPAITGSGVCQTTW